MTLKELLQKVDQREWEREDLNKKYLNLMKCHIAQQLKELKVRGAMMTKAREKRRRKERVSRPREGEEGSWMNLREVNCVFFDVIAKDFRFVVKDEYLNLYFFSSCIFFILLRTFSSF